jgi:Bacterial PH domain
VSTRRPALRFRKSGALLVAALIAFVGAVPVAGARWAFAPLLLVPLLAGVWAWRAGTDADAEGLRVHALFGTTAVPWARVAELAPDRRGRVSALLTDGRVLRLTAVTREHLPALAAVAGGQAPQRPAR